jgi:branched-chain amino acid transport system permease protein
VTRSLARFFALLLTAGLLTAGLTGCAAGPDRDQARICQKFTGAFHERAQIRDLKIVAVGDGRSVVVRFRVGEDAAEHWVACAFKGKMFDAARTEVEAVATDGTGRLSPVKLHLLRIWADLRDPAAPRLRMVDRAVDRAGAVGPVVPWLLSALYLLQQLFNAATAGCVYGLLAVGYTLVYAVLGRVNFAMGELTMIGAVVAALGAALAGMLGAGTMPLALLLVLATSMLVAGLYGWTLDRLAFQPLHRARGHAPLILAVGVAVAAQESVRLLQGARDRWPPQVFADVHVLAGHGGFTLTAITAQGVIVWLTFLLYVVLSWVMRSTRFGRLHRACVDDPAAAALMGVDVDRVIAWTFAVGGLYAGAAGAVIALYYGGVGFFTGYLVGFKALTAAVVGGIGSVPGALLGGALLAAVEALWSAYLPLAYKDVAVFSLLALFMIARPQGLLGSPRGRGD